MDVLREVNGFCLNRGELMANGIFNISIGEKVSLWFGNDTKDELLNCTDDEFLEQISTMQID